MNVADLTAQDEPTWVREQALALREKRFEDVDVERLSTYLSEMSRSDENALFSHLRNLITHMLKVAHQPQKYTASWRETILNQQDEIETLLARVPSLKSKIVGMLPDAYQAGVKSAVKQTGLPSTDFPATCVWSLQELLSYIPPEIPSW